MIDVTDDDGGFAGRIVMCKRFYSEIEEYHAIHSTRYPNDEWGREDRELTQDQRDFLGEHRLREY
jgi:hypothetical protein